MQVGVQISTTNSQQLMRPTHSITSNSPVDSACYLQ